MNRFGGTPVGEIQNESTANAAKGGRFGGTPVGDPIAAKPVAKPEPKEPTFLETVQTDFAKRKANMQKLQKDLVDRGVTEDDARLHPATQVNALRNLLGSAGDFTSEGVKALYKMTPPEMQNFLNETFKTMGGVGELAAKTPTGQAYIKATAMGAPHLARFKEAHPFESERIEDAFIVSSAAIPLARKTRGNFLDDIVTPHQSMTEKVKQVARTDVNWRRKNIVKLDSHQKDIKSELAKISKIKPNNTNQMNYNIIDREIAKEGNSLMKSLEVAKVPVNPKELAKTLDNAVNDVFDMPAFADMGRSQVPVKMAKTAAKIYKSNPKTLSGLLKTRRDFDAAMKQLKGGRFVAQDVNGSLAQESYIAVRSALNGLIEAKAPSVAVRNSLKKQQLLYDAQEIIRGKAAREAPTMTGRTIQAVEEKIPQRPTILKR